MVTQGPVFEFEALDAFRDNLPAFDLHSLLTKLRLGI